ATLVGHGTVRGSVIGWTDRPPSPAALVKMERLVEQAMREGAFGLSTGLIYAPGMYAKTDELVALARVAARHGGIYASHIRIESPSTRRRIVGEMLKNYQSRGFRDLGFAKVAQYAPNRGYEGRSLVEIARQSLGRDEVSLEAQLEQVLVMLKKGNASMIYHSM